MALVIGLLLASTNALVFCFLPPCGSMVMILHEKVSAMFIGFDSILVKDHVAHIMLKSGSC